MDRYEFGMKATPQPQNVMGDFRAYTPQDGLDYNPYNKAYFDNPANMSACNATERITSIPSPYARMHITDLAFQEYNCGIGVMNPRLWAQRTLSADYLKAMSHCLDLFELMFHSDEYDLTEKGITIQKINLVSTNSIDPQTRSILYDDMNGKLTSIGRYIATLDLFRDEYVRVIQSLNVPAYRFDFKSMYVFKYNGKVFASTSPFTGFCSKCNCNLHEADIRIGNRVIMSSDPATWLSVEGRDFEFRKFMYLLLKDTGLKSIFKNLYKSIENSFQPNEKIAVDQLQFGNIPEYNKFNIAHQPLQRVRGTDIYIRPDGLDCSYLKYLLYLDNPVDLTIHQSDYEIDLNNRRFPSTSGPIVKWMGVNDILSDALFVLTYEINDNYIVVPYCDHTTDDGMKRRCLIPVKRAALEYFTIDQLINNMTITRRNTNEYSVALRVELENGGSTVLRRDYRTGESKFPNGVVVQGERMKPFAFGIYPFVKSPNNKNIYKVLFYNSFENEYNLSFFKRDKNGTIQPFLENARKKNQTNNIHTNENELPVNCEYHHLETGNGEGLEFAEIQVGGKLTSLIIPKMREVHGLPGTVNVAIDLGTSNTYIGYTYQPEGTGDGNPEIHEICTNHDTWNELTFMNKRCEEAEDPNAPEKNREDLYLQTSDRPGARPSDEWLDSQLCEFIPSRIDPNMGDNSYCFPIPTVINFLRQNAQRDKLDYNTEFTPLLHCAIPFAYYERGTRKGDYFDLIKDGSKFKWFYSKDEEGNYVEDKFSKACFKAFVNELLFIVRCHLVSKGYSLGQTRILWSYPLSFSKELVEEYISTWNNAYRSIINPVREDEISEYVKYTNESRSPIFECLTNPANVDHLTLLVDVGGGSTDIIGYKNHRPCFITSFGFAGNSLYLDGNMNTVDRGSMSETVMYNFIKKQPLLQADNNEGRTKRITLNDSISTIMNYGFSKDPANFRKIFHNPAPKYMLQMHNAALIYHIAQLCKIKSPNELPVQIFLTGNGSKLFELNADYKNMIRGIFEYVVDSPDIDHDALEDIRISKPTNPKAATVRGALKGISNNRLATNDDALLSREVLLGDNRTTYSINPDRGFAIVNYDGDYREGVKNNVKNFIEMFYSIVYANVPQPIFSQEEVLRAVDFVANDGHLRIQNNTISDSLFFQHIALLMQKLSFDYIAKLNQNN